MHARFNDGFHLPIGSLQCERYHNLVGELEFRYAADNASGFYRITYLYARSEVPFSVRNRIEVHTSFQEEATLFRQFRKRILKTIEYLCQESRSQLNAH